MDKIVSTISKSTDLNLDLSSLIAQYYLDDYFCDPEGILARIKEQWSCFLGDLTPRQASFNMVRSAIISNLHRKNLSRNILAYFDPNGYLQGVLIYESTSKQCEILYALTAPWNIEGKACKSIGRNLTKTLISLAKEANIPKITVSPIKEAIDFWKKIDFRGNFVEMHYSLE